MKEKNKVVKIIDAFTNGSDIAESIIIERRKICDTCEYNSNNIELNKLSVKNKIRKKVIKSPFCTACGCQIYEKTSQGGEECGMVAIGAKPKWHRVLINTIDYDFDLVNLSQDIVNVAIDTKNKNFEIDYGIVNDNNVSISIVLNHSNNIQISKVSPGCGICTKLKTKKNVSRTFIDIKLDFNFINNGEFAKNIYIEYKNSILNSSNRCKIILKGKNGL